MKSHGAKILVVLDDQNQQLTITNVLLGQGYDVLTALDPDPDSDLPDMVLTSTSNTSLTPDELCRGIMKHDNSDSLPILILCGQNDSMDWARSIGCTVDFIREPADRETVLSRTHILLTLGDALRELDETREKLLGSQKLECVGALAAGVAHEFNNLMCAVMGFAEMANDGDGTDIEALKESAEISYQAAQRASSTAASLLAFSRQARSSKSMNNVNEIVSAALRLLRKNIEKNGVSVTLDLNDVPETRIAAGPIQQVFLNLIINAWHAMMDSDGKRHLSISSYCENDSKICIAIEDTGRGIPEAIQEKIFEPFFTTKQGKTQVKGTGLGLSLVREVIRDHGGLVQMDSETGRGTKFTIVLPVDCEEADTEDSAGTEGDAGEEAETELYSVLVIDDEEASRRIIARLLSKSGHTSYTAPNMAQAISLLWSKRIDLIFMDMVMPDGDGATNIAQLREMGIQTPVLICTGLTDDVAISRGLEAGASAVLMKPFSGSEFRQKFAECLANSTASYVPLATS